MYKVIIKFDGTEIEECEFRQYKSPILINNKDINEKVISNKFHFGNKISNLLLVTKKLRN